MKKVIALILAVMMLSSLGVFASADYENIPEMTLLYDTTCTEASTSGQGALITVKEIEEMTGGKVKVDKYDNYSLYPQDQIIPEEEGRNMKVLDDLLQVLGTENHVPHEAIQLMDHKDLEFPSLRIIKHLLKSRPFVALPGKTGILI